MQLTLEQIIKDEESTTKVAALDGVVTQLLQVLRELECDGDITTNSMEDNIHHVFLSVLLEVYGSNQTDQITALGLVEMLKSNLYNAIQGN